MNLITIPSSGDRLENLLSVQIRVVMTRLPPQESRVWLVRLKSCCSAAETSPTVLNHSLLQGLAGPDVEWPELKRMWFCTPCCYPARNNSIH